MKVIDAGNFRWVKKGTTFIAQREFYIHQYKRYFTHPLETTEHGTDLFFVSREKDLDLLKYHDKFVAIISRNEYDYLGNPQRKTKFCRTSYAVIRKGDKVFYDLIAALPMKNFDLLYELTLDVVRNIADSYMAPSSTG